MLRKPRYLYVLYAVVSIVVLMATTGAASRKTPEMAQMLLPEGYKINGLSAKLVRQEKQNRWFMVFAPLSSFTDKPVVAANSAKIPGDGNAVGGSAKSRRKMADGVLSGKKIKVVSDPLRNPIEVLPGKWLTAMIRVVKNKTDTSITFRVWGEITTYHHRNFIIPTMVATESVFSKKPRKTTTNKSLAALNSSFNSSKVNKKENKVQDNSRIPERLRAILLAMPETKILHTPAKKTNKDKKQTETGKKNGNNPSGKDIKPSKSIPASSSKQQGVSWKDGYMIVDRVGRLYYSDDAADMFIFESANTGFAEPSVILQPSSLLELMEKKAAQFTREVKFRVSGSISKYKGTYYMLLRKVLVVRNPQNLDK